MNCPVCGRVSSAPFLRRDSVPVHQNFVHRTAAAAIGAARGDLHLTCCEACGFVFNTAFDPAKLSYGDDYKGDQTFSPAFSAYVDDLVRHLVDDLGVRDCTILEIGSGSGYFLRRLVEHPGANLRGIGFDPAYEGPDEDLGGKLRFERRLYGRERAEVTAEVILCRHVIDHSPRPDELVRHVENELHAAPTSRIFFETPNVDWILGNDVIWDFYYEHCSLFSAASLTTLFEAHGVRVDAVERVFGGQYLWLEARRGEAPHQVRSPGETRRLAARFATRERSELAAWSARVRELRRRGPLAIWGAGAKGATFANLVDPEGALFDCLIDRNPEKQGTFVAGTGHPIVAPDALRERAITTAIVMNANYLDEIRRFVDEAGLGVELVT